MRDRKENPWKLMYFEALSGMKHRRDEHQADSALRRAMRDSMLASLRFISVHTGGEQLYRSDHEDWVKYPYRVLPCQTQPGIRWPANQARRVQEVTCAQ